MLTKDSLLLVRPMSSFKAAILRSSSAIGTIVSIYALYVADRARHDPEYDALCDISPGISCSKVLTSEWSYLFYGMPHSIIGVLYYAAQLFILGYIPNAVLFYSCFLSVLFSAGLIYVLAAFLKEFCMVCAAIHLINFSQFIAHIALKDPSEEKKQSMKKDN